MWRIVLRLHSSAGRSRSSGSAPTGEAAFAAGAAGMRLDGVCVCVLCVVWVCGCVRLFAVARCSSCGLCLFLLVSWLRFVVVSVFVGGVP